MSSRDGNRETVDGETTTSTFDVQRAFGRREFRDEARRGRIDDRPRPPPPPRLAIDVVSFARARLSRIHTVAYARASCLGEFRGHNKTTTSPAGRTAILLFLSLSLSRSLSHSPPPSSLLKYRRIHRRTPTHLRLIDILRRYR